MDAGIDAILNYWFGAEFENGLPLDDKSKLWFMGGVQADADIARRFAELLTQAENGQLEHWQETPSGVLAFIILLDQFSRNIYRGTAKAFGNDAMALKSAKQLLASNGLDVLELGQRIFAILPLEHSEQIEDQNTCVALVEKLIADADSKQRPFVENYLVHAQQHHEIIRRFGRFPHRNKVLLRETTAAEQIYLDQTGNFFGQK